MIEVTNQYSLQLRKKRLELHRQRLMELESQGRWREALEEFNLTLRCTIESLEHSIVALEEVNDQIDRLPPSQRERVSRLALASMTASLSHAS